MTASTLTMGPRHWAMLLLLSLLWGGSFFAAEIALHDFGPLTIAGARVALAAIALTGLSVVLGQHLPSGAGTWRDLAIMGTLNNAIPFSLIVWGQTGINGSLASILNATTPLFTVLLAALLTVDERLTPRRLGGVLLGFAGVLVMLGAGALRELGAQAPAQLAILGAALSYACAAIFGKRFRGMPPLGVAAGQTLCSSLILCPLLLVLERPWLLAAPSAAGALALISLGLLSTALAYLLYFRILAAAGATNVSLVTLLIPVSAIALGALFIGERLSGAQVLGMALIGAGLMTIDGRLAQLLQRRHVSAHAPSGPGSSAK